MAAMYSVVLALAAVASALPVEPVAKYAYDQTVAPAHYDVQYSAHDEHSGDVKPESHADYRFNPDGGYEGYSSIYAVPVTKIAYAAPAKVAYSAPIYHPAPVPKVAYSAPNYYAPPVKVPYSPPIYHAAPYY